MDQGSATSGRGGVLPSAAGAIAGLVLVLMLAPAAAGSVSAGDERSRGAVHPAEAGAVVRGADAGGAMSIVVRVFWVGACVPSEASGALAAAVDGAAGAVTAGLGEVFGVERVAGFVVAGRFDLSELPPPLR